jgi:hypothetical protein
MPGVKAVLTRENRAGVRGAASPAGNMYDEIKKIAKQRRYASTTRRFGRSGRRSRRRQ